MAFIRNSVEFQLAVLKKNNLYRRPHITDVIGAKALVNGVEKIHLCSNDYLGLSRNPLVCKGALSSLHNISPCSSRLVAGNAPLLLELEEQIAKHRGTESSLLYPNGYMANLGVITALANRETTIFSDELNHASIIDASRLSRATIKVFGHNDLEELKALLSSTGGDKMVVTEGVFSMDGDFSALDQICCLAKDYGATMIVDDAHGDFVFGSPGSYSGVPAYFDVKELIDINISSLSKGLGCFGGYVASSKLVRELLINRSRQFIYTSALPEHLCGAALAAIPVAVKGNLQHRLFRNVKLFYKKLTDLGFSVGRSTSQIIPVMIGAEKLAMEFANQLLLKGVFVQPIRYPTVGKGKARLRLTVTSSHAKADLLTAADSFEIVGKKNNII
ncbi:MAG TPA: aminotransferase class I/II-fold pyridoxal phosphate-dependent enzyme [Methylomirabilota bacterium]|nr:aminotransferase class I/II-fold pyridoxal phosphate-dependent enzyme [Methylomirabilota bacterium]